MPLLTNSCSEAKILKAGDGKKPSVDDTVACHYRAAFIDGTELDSSYKKAKRMVVTNTEYLAVRQTRKAA